MADFALKKGLDLPITGMPEQEIQDGKDPKNVAIVASDFIGLKPKILVAEGDQVVRGQALFVHKDNPEVLFTAPLSGRVRAINRGARRALQSVVIEVGDAADTGLDFAAVATADLADLPVDDVVEKLCKSGMWLSFRTRPYSKIPAPDERPAAIFITAMDSEPLAPNTALVIAQEPEAFEAGLVIIRKLSDGATHLCVAKGADIPGTELEGIETSRFSGPHPAGLAGTHMHFLCPPSAKKTVWSIGYQDVIAIGRLFLGGYLDLRRIVSLAGPMAKNPRLIRTIAGASTDELAEGEISGDDPCRIISGSVLSGHLAAGPFGFLGRYARQVTLIKEDHDKMLFGWITPQFGKYAVQPVLAAAARWGKKFPLTSNLNGGRRAMVPIGTFEQLMPQDYLPTQLLRALIVMDTDSAQELGALELDEEDLALCAFACPAKYEYGEALRDSLLKIEKEG